MATAHNRKAVSFGMDKQVRCSDRGNPEQHKSCLCNRAIDEKRTTCVIYDSQAGKAYGYWMPVAGAEDYIIHFSVGAFTVPES